MGTQILPSQVEESQPKLNPTIVSVSAGPGHSLVVPSMEHEAYPSDDDEDFYHQLPNNPSPGINIVPPNRQVQTVYSDYYQPNYHMYNDGVFGNQNISYTCFEDELNGFSLPENSLGESYGSYSDASLVFSPPRPDSEMEFGSANNSLRTHALQDLMNQGTSAADLQQLTRSTSDFIVSDVFSMDEVSAQNGHLFSPQSYEYHPLMHGLCSSSPITPAAPLETPVASQDSMASDSPYEEPCYLSPMSTDMSYSVASSCNSESIFHSHMRATSTSRSPTVSDHPLSRTSSNRIRKAPSDLILVSGPSGSRHYHCKFCPHTCKRTTNMREHQKKHDPNRPRPFVCMICSKGFARKSDLKRHVRLHLKEDPETAEFALTYISLLSNPPLPHSSFG
ncbi:hypothetical protein INT43_000476 [Umbelopsis isabellina]|uniref:C2H2-type domain-containing protein n=1 Tax=Mortierella isabellina TaxID=91625 RepID=A0A8H7UK03_MORIS|nr:hypothetical protein INT43_000476 [Umbelopsis isabellina]